jgi:DNA-directed RNA polymerase subunit RPC12/RpoP
MFVSKCAKCGKHRTRWAIEIPRKSECPNCGSKLAIHDEIVGLDLNYDGLLQSRDTNQEEWQDTLGKTVDIFMSGKLPNVISIN